MTEQSLTSTELTNADVQVKVHEKPACRVELHVKTSPTLVKQARKNAIKSINKEVDLPGFRKGKAPEAIIEKKFTASIEKELPKALADLAYVEAQKVAKIPLLNNNAQITFDLKEKTEEGAELIFSFETEPKIPSIDLKLFEPKPVDLPQVGEKEIEEAIKQMLFFYAVWKPVEDRPIKEGDYIMIDLDTIEGETAQRVFQHVRFEVSKARMAKWMQNLVIGAKSKDVLEGISEPDEDASEKEKAEFTPKKVRITIIKVEEADLPEPNDEFAKKVGAEDVAAMRKSITDMLNSQREQKINASLREQINEFLVEKFSFELPQSLIDAEKKHRFQQMFEEPQFKKRWGQMSEEEKKKVDDSLTEESAQAVRLFYLSRQVVHDTKISITHKEVQDEAIATLQAGHRKRVDIDKIPREVYALALSKVILMKAQDAVLKAVEMR